jgi:hypothetical protein
VFLALRTSAMKPIHLIYLDCCLIHCNQ